MIYFKYLFILKKNWNKYQNVNHKYKFSCPYHNGQYSVNKKISELSQVGELKKTLFNAFNCILKDTKQRVWNC